ncbi:Scr1 family TA system antitoxin-like transcriptional regulator [Actinoplanes sp. NPDC051859]|uniref:helix-turn-helix domain-containing protein n=1 Tax=Actinoplanes sp. NPDC051859 TaxID=3363909 RepID=UPI00378EBA6A
MMVSPYVRRRRLAMEILRLRDEYGFSADRLASAVGVKRQTISRIENGHVRPDPDLIMRILAVFNVGEKRWAQIMTIAREAQERGWWERHAEQMGPRQALSASLEAGAHRICEYQMTLLPGLLQTPAFSQSRVHADPSAHTQGVDPARALEARLTRQRLLERPGGPTYEVVIDELAIRRFAAPARVIRGQLRHLADLGRTHDRVTIRVLPIAASIAGHVVPRSAFSIYRYPDSADPIVVSVDTITSDLVLTEAVEVGHYLTLYDRLRAAALTPEQTLDFLAAVAEELPEHQGAN